MALRYPARKSAIIAAGATLQGHGRTIAPPPSQITLSDLGMCDNQITQVRHGIRTLVMQLVEGFRALT
jgi:hypothetical protein